MADNVQLSTGALSVATKDQSGVQHQEVVGEFLSGGGSPIQVSTTSPLPSADDQQIALLTAILIELRISNEMVYAQMNTEVEPLGDLRNKYKDFPITL